PSPVRRTTSENLPMTSERGPNDIPSGLMLRHTLRGHSASVGRMAWSPDGRLLITPAIDGTFRLWDSESGKLLLRSGSEPELYHRTADLETEKPGTQRDASPFVNCAAWSPDGWRFATGYGDGSIRIWDVSSSSSQGKLKAHEAGIPSLAWSPDGSLLASSSEG